MSVNIPTRQLGKNGPRIPSLGLGLMGLRSFYGTPPPDEERFKLLDRAHELGCRHWDSAALYGDSEVILGKWFQRTDKREEIFLATKFGNHATPEGGREIKNDPEYIRQSVAQSLDRLQTDYIDLLYCHRFSGKTPVEDIVMTMKEFLESGRVRYIGLSECGVDTLRRASKIHQISAYQIEYSPFSMEIEDPRVALLKTCRELGIATVAYSPLGRGMLTGRYRSVEDFDKNDFRRTMPRFSSENLDHNIRLVNTLKSIADSKGCTAGADIFPIPGTKKIEYLEENWHANDVTLTPAEVREVRQAIELADVHGTRVAEHLMGALVKDTPRLPC
ncbi:hypothetical protein M434DRAFT_22551 [Hypoxylon sp. CO27-5]|nr:hypothetical protein M434DRAFT_22551 [Hypoxylon sp. CO27-5]